MRVLDTPRGLLLQLVEVRPDLTARPGSLQRVAAPAAVLLEDGEAGGAAAGRAAAAAREAYQGGKCVLLKFIGILWKMMNEE